MHGLHFGKSKIHTAKYPNKDRKVILRTISYNSRILPFCIFLGIAIAAIAIAFLCISLLKLPLFLRPFLTSFRWFPPLDMGQNSDDLPGWIFLFFFRPFQAKPHTIFLTNLVYSVQYIFINTYYIYTCIDCMSVNIPIKMGKKHCSHWQEKISKMLILTLVHASALEKWWGFREEPSAGVLKGGCVVFFKTLLFDKFEGFNNTILYSSSPVILVILNRNRASFCGYLPRWS